MAAKSVGTAISLESGTADQMTLGDIRGLSHGNYMPDIYIIAPCILKRPCYKRVNWKGCDRMFVGIHRHTRGQIIREMRLSHEYGTIFIV